MADPIVGIDLGTSNTVVAYAEEAGSVRVLSDEAGYKIHPSVVSFHPNGGVVVGAAAKQRKVIDPKNTIFSVKRLIGRTYASPEVQTAKSRMPYEIKEGANQQPIVTTRGGDFAVPEVSAIILDHVRNVAAGQLGTEVNRAVVTVPASFNDAQRSATATSGAIAGLTIVRVLNEPTAAALAYGHTRNLRETIAVYDFGGGTFDITILRLEDQVYEVLGTAGDTFLGGDDLDERLVDRMVDKFLAENRIDLRSNEVSMMRLRAVAEQTKIELSRRSRAVVRVDEIAYGPRGKPLDLQIEISRDEFVRQVADIIDRTFPVCQEALAYAGLSVDRINDVILVGGTTKIPYVRDQVSRFFARAPRTDVSPEDAVAMGAALQATSLERILKRKSPSRVSGAVQIQPADTQHDRQHDTQHDTLTATTVSDELTESATMPQAEYPIPQVGDDDDLLELAPPGAAATGKRTTASYGALGRRPAPPATDPDRAPARGQHHDRLAEATPPPSPPPQAAPIGRMTKQQVTPRPEPSRPPPMTGSQRTTQPPPMTGSQRTTQPPPMTGSQRTTQPPPMTGSQRTTQPTGSQRTTQPTGGQRTTQPRTSQPPPMAASQPPPSPATTRPGMAPASAQTLYGVPPGAPAPSTQPGQPPPTPPTRRAQPTPPAPQPRVKAPTTQSRVAEKPPASRIAEPPPPGLAPLGPASTTRPVLDPLAAFDPELDPLAGFANELDPLAFEPDLDPRAGFAPSPDPLAGFAHEELSVVPPAPAQARTLIVEPSPPPAIPVAAPQAPTMMLEPSPSTTAKGFGAIGPSDTAPALPPASTAKGFAPPVQSFAMHNPVVIDVTPRGLGIGTVAGFCEELIRRNSRVPMEIRKLFTTSRDAQDTVRIIVCQGESRRLDHNVVIGDLTLAGLPKRPRGETSIEVTFMLDASGILQVRARDAHTGHEQRATLDLAGAMPQAEVAASRERMQALRR